MKIHHLNCGTCCPVGGYLLDGYSTGISAHLVCYCLLIETENGLVLIDTGYGAQDIARPRDRLSNFFLALNRPQLRPRKPRSRRFAGSASIRTTSGTSS